MFRGNLKKMFHIPIREALGKIAHVRLSKRRHEHSTEIHELYCTKLNSDTVASYDYMIHCGNYYIIVDKENILLLLDGIDQEIIGLCHQNFI